MISLWKNEVLFISILIIMMTSVYCKPNGSNIDKNINSSTNLDDEDNFKLVSKQEWQARGPKTPLDNLALPVKYVIISHTVNNNCSTQAQCIESVKNTQTFHTETKNWSDIGYNFLIGGDGHVYVGRGWDHVGAHTLKWNTKSIGISFIGNFNDIAPPEYQLKAAQKLIEMGVKLGKISEDYVLLGHRQATANTLSPGNALYAIIQTWPHWSANP